MIRHGWLVLAVFVGVCLPSVGRAATLNLSAGSTEVAVGQTVTVTARVNAGGRAINAAEGTITYPADVLKLTGVSKSGTIFTFWALEPTTSTRGQVSFIGGLPHPGYTGSNGTIMRLTFIAQAAGKATIRYSGGKVLADDGYGTNILTSQGSATITVATASTPSPVPAQPTTPGRPAVVLSSSTHPDQNAWYQAEAAVVTWSRPPGLLELSYVFDQQAGTVPDEVVEKVGETLPLAMTTDGTWYIHVRGRYESGWSSTTTFALHRDQTAPENFSVTLDQRRGPADPSPALVFVTTDAASGVAGYTVMVDAGAAVPAVSPYELESLTSGEHTLTVVATDKAGNKKEATTTVIITGYPAPVIEWLSSPIMLLDSFTVRGLANAGDVVVVALDGETIGQITAGQADRAADTAQVAVRVAWSYTSTRLIAPGRHTVTATAIGPNGHRSSATDPKSLIVAGNTVMFRGRPVATVAVAPAIAVGLVLLLALNAFVYWRIWRSAQGLVRREDTVEREIEEVRQRLRRERMTVAQLDASLQTIEADLTGTARPVLRRRRANRRSS